MPAPGLEPMTPKKSSTAAGLRQAGHQRRVLSDDHTIVSAEPINRPPTMKPSRLLIPAILCAAGYCRAAAAVAYPDDLGRLPTVEAARHRLQNHFLNLHRPFRFLGGQQLAGGLHVSACPAAVFKADRSNANNIDSDN